jgi:type II secretion system protein C
MSVKKSLSLLLSLALLPSLAWQSAQLFWQVVAPQSLTTTVVTTTPVAQLAYSPISFFGDAQASSAMNNKNAPDANILNGWILWGTILDDSNALALVQMGSNGLHWLKKGEQLPNGLQVVSVSSNDVKLLTAQGVKSLTLFTKHAENGAPVAIPAEASAAAATSAQSLQAVRTQLRQNPLKAMQLMRMDPVWSKGQLSGLTLMPQTGQEALFSQLGLKSGDVLVALNGEPVSAWMTKMADLPKVLDGNGARVKVLRAGTEKEWAVNW